MAEEVGQYLITFAYHIVYIKQEITYTKKKKSKKFTYHIVYIKPLLISVIFKEVPLFTYHIVYIKPIEQEIQAEMKDCDSHIT